MSAQHLGPDGPPPTVAVAAAPIVVGVLGVIAIRRDDATLRALPGARARLLLAALAVRPGRARSAQALVDEVWGDQPPRAPMNALHTQVSRLRALLPDGALEIGPAGYRLTLPADSVDLTAAAALVHRADDLRATGDTAASLAAIAAARALWRGEPGADLPESGPADDLRAAADQLRRDLDRAELAAHTARGDVAAALPLAAADAAAHPLDEPAHTTLIRLLAAAGRTGDALETFAIYRLRLIEELGADPGPTLLALNTAVLRGDPIELPGARHRPGGPPDSPHPATGIPEHDAAGSAPANPGMGDRTPAADPMIADPTAWAGATGATDPGSRDGWSASTWDTPAARLPGSAVAPIADRVNGQPRTLPPTSLGLRAAPNELLGRAADLDAITDLARRSRVTTVLGPGGTGKTRVANAVGERLTGTMPVVLVELAPVQAESAGAQAESASVRAESAGARAETTGAQAVVDIEAAIGHVMGLGEVIREPGGLRLGRQVDQRTRLRDALAARPTLLILDNCEHVIEAAAEVVADLVGSCAQLTVLTTSRSPLAITAESVYPLAPLAIDAAGSPATDLFTARARAVRPDVRLDPEIVARLCRTLDGLPLAIELAAARVRTMSVAEIEARLEHRFALLRSGDRAAPQRHRTLHAVIAWSWNLLDLDQQIVLRRLSRFPGGFILSAAEVVAAGPEVADVAAAVDGLVGQSLLTVLDDPDGTGIRYRMLETVREFGAEQLAAVDAVTDGAETTLVRERMAGWAREFVLGAVRDYPAVDQVPVVLAVTAELDNLVAVLRTATAHADADTVYTVFPVVATLWVMRGAHLEFIGWAVRLVAIPPPRPVSGVAADLQMVTHMLTCLHLMFHNGGDARPVALARMRARRLLQHPGLDPGLRLLGALITVRPHGFRLGRLLAEGAHAPERSARVAALAARANFWENAGNVAGSTRDALRALDEMESRDVWGAAMMSQHLAQLCGQSARYAESATHYRRALTQMSRLRVDDEILEGRCFLSAVLIGAGQREQARAELDFVLRSADSGLGQVDDPTIRRNHRLSTVATAVAELELADGDIDAGLRHYRRALELLGWPDFELSPGPGALMVSAAAVSAHVLYGRAGAADDLVAQIVATTDRRLSQYLDLPQIGAVACAVGSYLLTTDPRRPEGLELFTLAAASAARQDYPSMELARHRALHRDRVGADALARAERAAAGVRRLAAATRIVELVTHLDGHDNGTRP
ncbi:BTAD domain-containing putative transcriptional regulator [Nocardia sp. NPDC058379]|uniref:AfsR/SARP family transcriptional regulator n=1 Tax=unclassified Nocardia TaxID=2637762 RepID=UPI0036600A24